MHSYFMTDGRNREQIKKETIITVEKERNKKGTRKEKDVRTKTCKDPFQDFFHNIFQTIRSYLPLVAGR